MAESGGEKEKARSQKEEERKEGHKATSLRDFRSGACAVIHSATQYLDRRGWRGTQDSMRPRFLSGS